MPEVKPSDIQAFASIKVVGVGGAGGSAVNRMKDAGLTGVQFIAINTDAQALHNSKADVKVHIGRDTTRGLGAGADPTIGESAANESRDEIRDVLQGADLVFVTIGAGGGTGSGAGHVVAEVARELGILVIGVATKPFSFEGEKRRQNADWAIAQLGRQVDTLITIPNDRLLRVLSRRGKPVLLLVSTSRSSRMYCQKLLAKDGACARLNNTSRTSNSRLRRRKPKLLFAHLMTTKLRISVNGLQQK